MIDREKLIEAMAQELAYFRRSGTKGRFPGLEDRT